MDVGFYLGELLMQQGEVSVPGLGYFVQVRISGYYDENERKFYPPYHQAQFDVQSIDDDALAEYIAVKKNISVASARYFAEKYITNLKQQALIGEVPIGNLGTFYTELAQLTFRPADKIIDDTIFYGLEPISINKTNDAKPLEERPIVELNYPPKTIPEKPVVTEEIRQPVAEPELIHEAPAQPAYQEEEPGISPEFFDPNAEEEEEIESRGPLRLILAILIMLIVIGIGIFALYRYQPDTFAKIAFWQHKAKVADTIKSKPVVVTTIDTAITDTTKVDTTTINKDSLTKGTAQATTAAKKTEVIISKTEVAVPKKKEVIISQTEVPATTKKKETIIIQPAVTKQNIVNTKPAVTKPATATVVAGPDGLLAKPSDAVGTHRFEVYVGRGNSTIAETNVLIKTLRKKGLDPRVVTDASGNLYHISIGHFATKQEATDFAFNAIEGNKVPGGDAFGFEIIPQK